MRAPSSPTAAALAILCLLSVSSCAGTNPKAPAPEGAASAEAPTPSVDAGQTARYACLNTLATLSLGIPAVITALTSPFAPRIGIVGIIVIIRQQRP